jgi:hypothetical protein
MVSNLAESVNRIHPFVRKVQEKAKHDEIDLLEEVITRILNIVIDTAEFVCSYVHRSALSMSITF